MDEKRRFFRFESPIKLNFTTVNKRFGGKAKTRDVSRGGISLSVDKRLAREDLLDIEFDIPGDNMPVFAQGSVVWVKEHARRKIFKARNYDVGVKFTEIARHDRGKILEHAYAQWLKLKNLKTLK